MESIKTSKVILICIKDKNKLRIKFHNFIDTDDKIYTNMYNNNYNCRFPKNIRQEGYFYEIPDTDITLNCDKKRSPFYIIKKDNIKIIKPDNSYKLVNLKIYDVKECVICLCENSNTIFLPCGHKCVCNECYENIKKNCNKSYIQCPLCRRNITDINFLEKS
jgi:hypothetical protein